MSGEDAAVVATAVTYCVTHQATDHDDGRAWSACRFRQLFYFENPADEDALTWADADDEPAITVDVGFVHTRTEQGGPCRDDCPHPAHIGSDARGERL